MEASVYFEDIEEGFILQTDPQIVTQDMIERFADLTGDHNPFHIDEEFAARGPFRGIVCHGRLTGDLAIGMLPYEFLEGMMLLADSTEYMGPVIPGDHLVSMLKITKKEERSSKYGFIYCDIQILNQDNAVIAMMRVKMSARKRPS